LAANFDGDQLKPGELAGDAGKKDERLFGTISEL
jgi:hypothetical protein